MANRLVRNKAGLACPCMSNITLTMSGGLAAWRTSRAVGHGGVHGQFQRKHVTNHWKCPHKTMDDKKMMKMVTGIAMYTGFCVQINYLREKMNSMGQCLVTCSQRGAECSQRDPFLRTEWPIFLAGACSSLSLPAECESVVHQTGNIAILIQLYKAFANHRWPTPTLPPILPVFQSFHSCWYQFFDLTTKMRRQQKNNLIYIKIQNQQKYCETTHAVKTCVPMLKCICPQKQQPLMTCQHTMFRNLCSVQVRARAGIKFCSIFFSFMFFCCMRNGGPRDRLFQTKRTRALTSCW